MITAIDSFDSGKEVEAPRGITITARTGRYYCPICFKAVALNRAGYFQHTKRDSEADECERRVASYQGSVYEKLGLPIFLLKKTEDLFELYLGFPSQQEEVLEDCQEAEAYLEIKGALDVPKKYFINMNRFSTDTYTFVSVPFLPINNSYIISYSDTTPKKIHEKWTDFSDTWDSGRFFKKADGYCRKIRQGSTLLLDTEYYFSGSDRWFTKFPGFVEIHECGKLSLEGSFFSNSSIYNVLIRGESYGTPEFQEFEKTLYSQLKMNVAKIQSELRPLWPPCVIDNDTFVYDISNTHAEFWVESIETQPKVYKFADGALTEEKALDRPAIYSTDLFKDQVLIVDKIFTGNSQNVIRKSLKRSGNHELVVAFLDLSGRAIEERNLSSVKKTINIQSNFKGTVVWFRNNTMEVVYKLSDKKGIELGPFDYGDRICVYSSSWKLIDELLFEKRDVAFNTWQQDETIINYLKKCRDKEVDITNEVIGFYRMLDIRSPLRTVLARYVKRGKIPESLVINLRKYKRGI